MSQRALKPYLMRAVMDYCGERQQSPHVMVAVDDSCQVPLDYVNDGMICFDISEEAVGYFRMDEDSLTFKARFGEDNHIENVVIPMGRIARIFPMEEQQLCLQFPVVKTEISESSEDAESLPRPKRLK